jgi:tRNA A58 N-methylase Trm61
LPTDIGLIVANLVAFHDFRGQVVVHVGAGGGQLMGYARSARRVIAVDKDRSAIQRLELRLAEDSLQGTVSVVTGDFCALDLRGDVVLFEFCLHEMPQPEAAIAHAREGARDVVVIDHLPVSRWSWYADESEAMARAWAAVEAAGARRRQSYEAVQSFRDHAELRARLATQGDESLRRISEFERQAGIVIPMPYGIALL